MKKLLSSALKSNEDPHLALLQYRITLVDNNIVFAAEIMFPRNIRNIIPALHLDLETKNLNHTEIKNLLKVRQKKRKTYYDRGCKTLTPFEMGDKFL